MKKFILNLIILFSVSPLLHAQGFELSVGANTGLFAYKGPGSTSSATMFTGQNSNGNYVDNPYGSKYAFSYGAFIQPQYVFKSGFLIGLQGSYDILRSKTAIANIYPAYQPQYSYTIDVIVPYPASGRDILQAQEINFNPYIGYRIIAGDTKVDVMPGISFGFNINDREKGKADAQGETFETNNKLPDLRMDTQLKLGVSAEWHRWALVAGYAYGLSDILPLRYTTVNPEPLNGGPYMSNSGSDNKIHSSLFELGISYRLFAGIVK